MKVSLNNLAVSEQWVFLFPKEIRGKVEGIAPSKKYALFELQVLEEGVVDINTNKIKPKNLQTVYRYFLGMSEAITQTNTSLQEKLAASTSLTVIGVVSSGSTSSPGSLSSSPNKTPFL